LKTLLADLYSFHGTLGALFIVSSNLSSQNICSVQSLAGLFIASVIQSEYKTAISPGSKLISLSFNNLLESLIIQIATHHDFILNVFPNLCL
jgi:hypothetical protein